MRPARSVRLGSLQAAPRALAGFATEHRSAILYAAFTLVVFLLALAATLPHEQIATRAIESATADTPVAVAFKSVGFAFPNGYHFTGVRIAPIALPEAAAQITDLTLRVPLGGLLAGRVERTSFAGDAYGGTLRGEIDANRARIAVRILLENVDLGRASGAFLPPGAEIGGRASLDLSLAGDGRTTQSSQGELTLKVAGLVLKGLTATGLAIPDLSFPDLELAAQVHGTRLQVKELRASGDELDLAASGDILLREPLPSSMLNLRLTIGVTPTARPEIRVATALLPRRAPGERPTYVLSGTLAAPVVR
jgi:type II secretion system protein N